MDNSDQIQRDMIERMTATYEASLSGMPDNPYLDERLRAVIDEARIFYKYSIPLWPPFFLVRKIIRRLFMPVLLPQVVFNEAVRDVLVEIRNRSEQQAASYAEALQRVTELEQQVDMLLLENASRTASRPVSPGVSAASSASPVAVAPAGAVGPVVVAVRR